MFNRCDIMEAYEAAPEVLVTPMEPGPTNLIRRFIDLARLYHAVQHKRKPRKNSFKHLSTDCHCTGKFCSRCKKPLCCLAFYNDRTQKDKLFPSCKTCQKARPKVYQLGIVFEHASDECTCSGKKCSKCNTWRCIGFFDHDKAQRNGLHPSCKLCSKAYLKANAESIKQRSRQYEQSESGRRRKRAYRESHREETRRYARNYHWTHRAERLRYHKRHRALHRDLYARNARTYRLSHIEACLARESAYHETHREREHLYGKMYRVLNREVLRERRQQESYQQKSRQYRETNRQRLREHKRAYKHRRRALLNQAGGSYTATEWQALKAHYDYTCLCCGKREPEIKLTPDHVRPIAKRGSGYISNIQPLCLPCNMSKGTKIIDYRPSYQERNKHA